MANRNANHDSDITKVLNLTSSSNPKRQLKRWLGWGIAVLLIVLAIIYRTGNNNAGPVQFKTQYVEQGDLTVTVTATGNLEPTNEVTVGSELSGIIETVEVDYNDMVKVGQVLAKLDTDILQSQVLQSKAALESARAKLLEAEATALEDHQEL